MAEPSPPLRVLLDAEAAGHYPGGIACYTLRLWAALRERPDLAVRAACPAWRPARAQSLRRACALLAPGARPVRLPLPRRALDACPWLARPWLGGPPPGVVHTPANAAPPWLLARRAPLVVTLHDLAWHPDADPGHASARYRRLVLRTLPAALARPDTVVCAVSRFTAREARERLGFPPDRVVVTPEGLHWEGAPPLAPGFAAEALARRGLEPEGYVLAVGQLAPRKNYPTLLEAFRRLRGASPEARLVVVGQSGWEDAPIRKALAGQGQAALHLEGLPVDELRALYEGARVVCCPSRYEGFGLPALEALASGRPLVYAAGTAMDEVAGDAGAAVPALDPEAMADTLVRLWRGAAERAARGEAGRARASAFTWAACARATAEAYRLAADLARRKAM